MNDEMRKQLEEVSRLIQSLDLLTIEQAAAETPFTIPHLHKLGRNREKNHLPFFLLPVQSRKPILFIPRACLGEFQRVEYEKDPEKRKELRREQVRRAQKNRRIRRKAEQKKGEEP
jgi:hypothetical protein